MLIVSRWMARNESNSALTRGTAEAACVPKIRKEFAAADIVKEHVEERLIVMGPDPVHIAKES